MDTYKESLYGKILWRCYRSKGYIIAVSLLYVVICTAGILYALRYPYPLTWLLTAVVLGFALWRINRVHQPVALICEKKLLVTIPWSFLNMDFDFSFKSLYMPVEYKEVAGVSTHWDRLYIGAPMVGGLVALPVQLSYTSVDAKNEFRRWVERKQGEGGI